MQAQLNSDNYIRPQKQMDFHNFLIFFPFFSPPAMQESSSFSNSQAASPDFPVDQIQKRNQCSTQGKMPNSRENDAVLQQNCQQSSIRQNGKHQEENNESEEYRPRKKTAKNDISKKYEKDENRNILPNTINKLFSYLRCKSKSQSTLIKLLQKHKDLKANCSPKKYYVYHSQLKSKMNKFMLEESIDCLFEFSDPTFTLFSQKEQLAIIKINSFLLTHCIKNKLMISSLAGSTRIATGRIYYYLKTIRRLRDRVETCIQKVKDKYDFQYLMIY